MKRAVTGMLVAGILLALTGCTTMNSSGQNSDALSHNPVTSPDSFF